jgi:16S rRNA (guanine966-N2)-methyltransferase
MRIIGGEARGRQIRFPKGCRIRPTTDRVKKSLFDILFRIEGAYFADIFAGCGNVGLEALSRGARRSVFIEKEPRLVDSIRINLRLLGVESRGEVIAADAEKGIRNLRKRGDRFDILFADPPYQEGYVSEIMKLLEEGDIMASTGVVVLQHSIRETLEDSYAQTMAVTDQRRYGDTMLSFLRKRGGEQIS